MQVDADRRLTRKSTLDDAQQARDAYARRAWRDAYHAFNRADEVTCLASDDIERFATTAYLIGRDQEFVLLLERLHRAHVDADNAAGAARATFWLALSLLLRGHAGQANAWVVRGETLVHAHECVERGYLLLHRAEEHLRGGDGATACAIAAESVAIGEHCDDADLIAMARHVHGRACIHRGNLAGGLTLLDQTMLAVIGGELSPIVTGLMYCSVIGVCRDIYELGRAREWTVALSRWCEQQSEMVAFTGTCLAHRAEVLVLQGAWSAAFAEADRARERVAPDAARLAGGAIYQQAEIHRLRGEFARADTAYRDASRLGYDPQPGLALLRLAQGRTDAAAASIRRLLIATTDRSVRARLLPAQVEIMVAIGDVDEAGRASRELDLCVETFGTHALRAMAAHARGVVALGRGDAAEAIGHLRHAFELWEGLDAPYEAARARVLLGQTYRALGDDEAGALECEAARSTFERLGARSDLTRLIITIGNSTTSSSGCPLTTRELEVLRLIAAGHTNKSIAETLSVSERTVDRHVSNMLDKLNVPSRAAATAYAYTHQLF